MSKTYDEEVNTQNVTSGEDTDTTSNNQAEVETKKVSDIVFIQRGIGDEMSKLAFRSSDASTVKGLSRDIFKTTCAVSLLDEFEEKLKVNGETVYINEYRSPAKWNALIAPEKIVAADVQSARDFLNRKAYNGCEGKVLDPQQYANAWKQIAMKLRVNPDYQRIEKEKVMLISEATKYAVAGRKVVDAQQSRILFLNTSFDSEAQVNITRWISAFVNNLFS